MGSKMWADEGIGPYRVRCKTVKRADRVVRPYKAFQMEF